MGGDPGGNSGSGGGPAGPGAMGAGNLGDTTSSQTSGDYGGFGGKAASSVDQAMGNLGFQGGLRSGARSRSGFAGQGGGGRDSSSPMSQGQPYGLGMSPDAFWAEYEKRYGVPVTQSQQMQEAQAKADVSVANYQKLTDDLLGRFEQSWGEVFGGQTGGVERGSLFPELAYESQAEKYTVPKQETKPAPAPTEQTQPVAPVNNRPAGLGNIPSWARNNTGWGK